MTALQYLTQCVNVNINKQRWLAWPRWAGWLTKTKRCSDNSFLDVCLIDCFGILACRPIFFLNPRLFVFFFYFLFFYSALWPCSVGREDGEVHLVSMVLYDKHESSIVAGTESALLDQLEHGLWKSKEGRMNKEGERWRRWANFLGAFFLVWEDGCE